MSQPFPFVPPVANGERELPLSGVRVADFTWIGAGSFTTKLLADLGADVIKIESGVKLDNLRVSPPFKDKVRGHNRSGYFADRNSSKRSITINLKTPGGLELARKIVRESDVVANNFSPGTMEKLGLGYDLLCQINPRIIYISMSVQGSAGPDAQSIGYGVTIGAMTGLQHLSGAPDREPVGSGTHFPDHVPNPTHAAFAILSALRHLRRTGKGQIIDMAQTEPMLALLAPALIDYAANGREQERAGNRNDRCAPRGVYPVAGNDRWIAISIENDRQWAALADVLNDAELRGREGWRTHAQRLKDQDAIDRSLAARTARWDPESLMHALQSRGVPAGVVQTPAEVVDHDPQLAHRGHWRRLQHPEMGLSLYNGQPFKFQSIDVGPRAAAPLLGQHSLEVCRDLLKLQPAEIQDLMDAGVLT